MSNLKIIDTFPEFLKIYKESKTKPIGKQIELWELVYMSQWPELLEKQEKDYSSQNINWREITEKKIFPFLGDKLPAMSKARDNLNTLCAPLFNKAQKSLGFDFDAVFVIYVGIGCGAGWATTFGNSPAILLGLENIAESGWSEPESLSGLIAHEIGHLVHNYWRAKANSSIGSGPLWQLYTEGFAQRCEHIILGKNTWHQATNDKDWLSWCEDYKSWLAAEFLRLVDAEKSVSPFFGSWFYIQGRKECGYFLGHELIKKFEANATIMEIALWRKEKVEDRFMSGLKSITR